MIEKEMKRKKSEPAPIKTLNKLTQVIYNWSGAYDMDDGSIHVGCDEYYTTTILWHESIHMLLLEQYDLESCAMWDNIANDLQEYLFNINAPEKPYILILPAIKAKSEDNGWYKGRKQKEKSIITGWKPDMKKRVPIRHIDEIYKAMNVDFLP